MDIRQLRYFIAIAEEKQISAAAKRLHIAQPPLSQQLKTMERELGVRLVERVGKGIVLTEAGQALYRHALSIAGMLEDAENEVRQVGAGTKGVLTIGINTLSSDALPELLRRFRQAYPDVAYDIRQNESAQLLRLVKERVVELAIVRQPLELTDFSVVHLQTERFCLIAANAFEAGPEPITYERIGRFPLIVPSTEGLGVHHLVMEQFVRRRLQPNVVCACSDVALLMELVASGFGVAIAPETVAKLHKGRAVRAYEIADSEQQSASVLVWLKQYPLSNTAQNFVRLVTD
ncbi:LysR family transcriptional regulator [Paenibacillus sp. GYB003]|uniref:LysR family transcriptional regulator n=1 Tax=Paenibacillus sp. GYB003 TaxID=2994392 RepID=UPI002F96D5B8